LGLSSLWSQHTGLVRGVDLIEAATARTLERLAASLEVRLPRRIEATPPLVRAGVLIPIFLSGDAAEVLFTRRTDTVLTHKGQISFPGGQREPTDASMVETALRESYEEIGLDPSQVVVLGELDDVFTSVSGFVVTPVIGIVRSGLQDLVPAPAEVRSLFTVSVDQLRDERVHTTQTREVDGQRYRIHYYTVGDDVIWGATGYIVHQFLQAWTHAVLAS
jgi:8-oxo-dGTP pyrophosphatase MutT (NUDIX family)